MMNRAAFVSLLLAAQAGQAAGPQVSDEQIVRTSGPDEQFRVLLANTVFATQTVAMAAYSLGIDRSCQLIRPAFEHAVAKRLPQWRANLVAAWRHNIPADELATAVTLTPADAARRTQQYLPGIANEMRTASEPLLKEAAAEVLDPVFAASARVDTSKIDSRTRGAELKAASANGTIFCGLAMRFKGPA